MSICFEIDNIVKFNVKGSFADRNGKDQPFSFTLTVERVTSDDIEAFTAKLQADGGKLLDFFLAPGVDSEYRTLGWTGPKDKAGVDLPFSDVEMEKLFRLPGVPILTWRRYLEEIQAKAKN